MSRSKKKRNSLFSTYAILVFMASFIVVPVLWMISTAFKTEPQTYYPQPKWIPDPFSLDSFRKFFNTYNFGRMTLNSLVVCLSAMIICVACACLAGYGVTRFRFKGRKQLMSFLLITQMFPGVMLVVPFYAVLSKYHLVNSLLGLVIVYAATNIAFSTWMIVSYFKTIPLELDEAARVDGASSFRIFWNIILPLIVPGIAAVAMFVLFNGWNEYMFSSVLVSKDELKTLTVGIISLNSQYQIKWNDLMAASSISSLPLVILFVSFQKYFIAGMTGGAVKS
ncbi:carbohydrate ABC transporter permease [Lacrimispora saccharolytica]|uniref:Binding-protein-dependent transport systems inner membrane component n=1 Tax=Lacrimispora saccharolytica (strain ATCC 35040 / DSM 2544 / NRCC 2533 / WM1) TaxID=610130 RepID=D9R3S9_LACSW|nr:carbohydrate ABC transporter permease [Lacrimispora saccharolytica]ADL03042.1 binding-protein-dependent transport systems inner membrane component [[Clostridium] saccharolyticum WM1]QRV18775.1 carbohydrate ABC transporter permease [Lacrimispora saccharolytica]